jgi:hypothetical protein
VVAASRSVRLVLAFGLAMLTGEGCGSGGSGAVPMPRPPPPGPYPRPVYELLSQTGLFVDPAAPTVVNAAVEFEPTHPLWSDAATKHRWVRLPPGAQIDSTDMDHWVFPIGTQLWKEFSLDGVKLETRLIERYGEGPEDYWMGAFVWNAAQTEAELAPLGALDIAGTPHDAPSQEQCGACHRGEVGRVLGLSALQVSRGPGGGTVGPTLADLALQGLLTAPPVGAVPIAAPGDPTTAAALGYLHANCGHCHNPSGTSWPDTQMVLRLATGEHDVESSSLYQSLVGKPLQYWRGGVIAERVVPGHPEASAIVSRMSVRGTDDQMPPLATEVIDEAGLGAVRAWIAGLVSSDPPGP